MGLNILECSFHRKYRYCCMNFCRSHLCTSYGVMVQNVFHIVSNRQMSLKATGVREQRVTVESCFRHCGQGKLFWGDAIWAKTWVKWEKVCFQVQLMAVPKALCWKHACRFESWQEGTRGCNWGRIEKSGGNGSQRKPGTRAWRSLWIWEWH